MPNKRPYDLLLITKPETTDKDVEVLKTQLSEATTRLGGQVNTLTNLGKRRLTFRLKDKTEGVYLNTKIELPADQLLALKKRIDSHAPVLRFMVTHAQAEVSHGESK